MPGAAARDALRRALVETLLHGNRAELVETLDETLLGLRPRPAIVARAPDPAQPRVANSARSWHRHVTGSAATVGAWTKQNGCSSGSSGSRSSNEGDAPAGVLLDELRQLVAEAEAWARAEGDARARAAAAALGERLSQAEEVTPLALVTE